MVKYFTYSMSFSPQPVTATAVLHDLFLRLLSGDCLDHLTVLVAIELGARGIFNFREKIDDRLDTVSRLCRPHRFQYRAFQ